MGVLVDQILSRASESLYMQDLDDEGVYSENGGSGLLQVLTSSIQYSSYHGAGREETLSQSEILHLC